MIVGGLLGIIAGLMRGWIDEVISTAMDAILAFPPLIFAIAIAIALGASVTSAAIGITVAAVPFYARLLRSDVLKIRVFFGPNSLVQATTASATMGLASGWSRFAGMVCRPVASGRAVEST